LKDTGFIEGETVAIEYRLAENQTESNARLGNKSCASYSIAALSVLMATSMAANAADVTARPAPYAK